MDNLEGIEPLSLSQITPEIRLMASRCILADAESGSFSRDAHKYAAYTIIRENQLKAALAANREKDAEIERLKIELAKTGTGDYKGDFYLGRKTLSGYLRDAEDDRDGWKRMYDAKKSEIASLRASLDNAEMRLRGYEAVGSGSGD